MTWLARITGGSPGLYLMTIAVVGLFAGGLAYSWHKGWIGAPGTPIPVATQAGAYSR